MPMWFDEVTFTKADGTILARGVGLMISFQKHVRLMDEEYVQLLDMALDMKDKEWFEDLTTRRAEQRLRSEV